MVVQEIQNELFADEGCGDASSSSSNFQFTDW